MKGQSKMMSDVFLALIIVALCISIYFLFVGYWVEINGIINSAENDRKAMNLCHILISYDMIAYSDEKRIYRGILDEEKLNNMDSEKLFDEISYPSYKYFIIINSSDNSWKFGDDLGNAKIIKKYIPVAIKSGESVEIGILSLTMEDR
jgi:hypothetical protein